MTTPTKPPPGIEERAHAVALEAWTTKARSALVRVAQVLDGWHQDGTAWTLWDEGVRKEVSELLSAGPEGQENE